MMDDGGQDHYHPPPQMGRCRVIEEKSTHAYMRAKQMFKMFVFLTRAEKCHYEIKIHVRF